MQAQLFHRRLISYSGGDCKLLSDASDSIKIPYVDLTITGRLVEIACNVTLDNAIDISPDQNFHKTNASINKDSTSKSQGTRFIWDSATNSSKSVAANASVSNPSSTLGGITYTSNSPEGAFVPAPPKKDFLRYNSTNYVCFSGLNEYLCLPSGLYQTSDGGFGFDSKQATDLDMPSGPSIHFKWQEGDGSLGMGAGGGADRPEHLKGDYNHPITDGSSNQA